MKLRDWLSLKGKSPARIMDLLECNRVRAWRILNGKALPNPTEMSLLFVDTLGLVQPNDFYDLPDLKRPPAKRLKG